jgi:hypothetical protein
MPSRFRRLIAMGVFLLALLISCSATTAGEPATSYDGVFDGGLFRSGEKLRHTFANCNNGKDTRVIKNAKASSESHHVLSYPQEIASRQDGKLQVRWVPSTPGQASSEMVLETNDPNQSAFRFTLKVAIGLLPATLLFFGVQPEKFIESDHREIRHVAEKLRAPQNQAPEKNLYVWAADHIRDSGYTRESRGALFALKKTGGDCTERVIGEVRKTPWAAITAFGCQIR